MYLSVPIYFLSAQVPLFHDNRIHMVVSSDALQKQVGCFNHRVVALVADKLDNSGC